MTNQNENREITKQDMAQFIWDQYKGIHGIRPRWIDFDSMSVEELTDMADSLVAEQDTEDSYLEDEANKICEDLGLDRETYDRWMKDADGQEGF